MPYVVAYSLMFGSIISWGIMWPLITGKAGDWYPSGLQDGDFRGLFGYKVSPAVLATSLALPASNMAVPLLLSTR